MFVRKCIFLIGLFFSALASAQQSAELTFASHYTLTVPSVNFLGIPGYYHQLVIQYQPVTGLWTINQNYRGIPAAINSASVVKTAEKPVQVFLKVEAIRRNGCEEIG